MGREHFTTFQNTRYVLSMLTPPHSVMRHSRRGEGTPAAPTPSVRQAKSKFIWVLSVLQLPALVCIQHFYRHRSSLSGRGTPPPTDSPVQAGEGHIPLAPMQKGLHPLISLPAQGKGAQNLLVSQTLHPSAQGQPQASP